MGTATNKAALVFVYCAAATVFVCAEQECPGPGWEAAADICFRVVHFPMSFWAAKAECSVYEGRLLQLGNVAQVMSALGDSMQGNAGDYRIDGWAEGTWYQRENETLEHQDYEFLGSMTGKTLTLNLQDGKVSADAEERTRLGFICQGSGQAGSGCGESGDMAAPAGRPEGISAIGADGERYCTGDWVVGGVADGDQVTPPEDSRRDTYTLSECLEYCTQISGAVALFTLKPQLEDPSLEMPICECYTRLDEVNEADEHAVKHGWVLVDIVPC